VGGRLMKSQPYARPQKKRSEKRFEALLCGSPLPRGIRLFFSLTARSGDLLSFSFTEKERAVSGGSYEEPQQVSHFHFPHK